MAKIVIASFVTMVISLPIFLTWQINSKCLKIYETKADLIETQKALDFFYVQTGNFPNDEIGLMALLGQTPPIRKSLKQDSWQQPFIYKRNSNDQSYTLYSIGKNGIDELGGGDDITTDKKNYENFDYGLGFLDTLYYQIP